MMVRKMWDLASLVGELKEIRDNQGLPRRYNVIFCVLEQCVEMLNTWMVGFQ
jgi:hypothetical protein